MPARTPSTTPRAIIDRAKTDNLDVAPAEQDQVHADMDRIRDLDQKIKSADLARSVLALSDHPGAWLDPERGAGMERPGCLPFICDCRDFICDCRD